MSEVAKFIGTPISVGIQKIGDKTYLEIKKDLNDRFLIIVIDKIDKKLLK